MNYTSTIKNLEKNYDKKVVVTLQDLEKNFKNPQNSKDNPIIYEVLIKKQSPINIGLTVLNPGAINKEFYMTRGHIHQKPTPEFYILLDGKGLLLLQKSSIIKKIILKKGKITLIPPHYAHRLINIGEIKLKVLTIYDESSMPNYKIKFKKRFFKK
ncbi:MAG: glucose-6-phosphate isomerase family protein [Nanoarchaeota archaeon]|nr:glucose-6-phosphate isomerase family protein [Nanoarchaeota archaeon]